MRAAIATAVGLLSLLGIAAWILFGRDRISSALWRRSNPLAKLAVDREAHSRRVQTPDWAFYAEHLRRTVPAPLVAWFADPKAVGKYYYFEEYRVAFSPIDRMAYEEEWVYPGVIAFAESDGDPMFLQPGVNSSDAVFIAFHDGGGVEQIAPSVQVFLEGLRDAT